MPNERNPKQGDIVYIWFNDMFEECMVVESYNAFTPGLCIVQTLGTKELVTVPNTQIVYDINTLLAKSEQVEERIQSDLEDYREIIDECESALSEMPDEYLDSIAPPEEKYGLTDEQDEYRLMYNATGSVGSILMMLLRCATSDNKLSDAELLAIRDKAETFGNMDIVNAIDSHFEEGDF